MARSLSPELATRLDAVGPGLNVDLRQADPPPPLWWVGCHGGAGASTLAAVTGLGYDSGAVWPNPLPHHAPRVVLVCRGSAGGMWSAAGVVSQWYRRRESAYARCPASVELLGLVVVAASPARPPLVVTERIKLLRGWLPKVWRVKWVQTYLAADVPDPNVMGRPPSIAALREDLLRALPKQMEETP